MFASKWCFLAPGTFGLALLSSTSAAAEPTLTAPAPSADDRRAAAVLATLGQQAGDQKTVSSWSRVIAGGTLTATGIVVDARYDAVYGPAFWITGVAVIANGLASLLTRPAIESFAEEMRASPLGLEARWRARAADAKSRRQLFAIVDLGIGVVAAGAATIVAAEVGDLSRDDRARWVTLAGIFSGLGFVGGLRGLLVASDIENGYALAYPERTAAARTLDVGIAALPNGAGVQLHGNF